MPVFAVTYTYGPDTDSRMEHRPAHRQWQSQMHEAGTILASGPLDDEPQPGGLLLMQAGDRAEIERLLTQGYATPQERRVLDEMYTNYKAHGWNGDMDARLDKVYALRTDNAPGK